MMTAPHGHVAEVEMGVVDQDAVGWWCFSTSRQVVEVDVGARLEGARQQQPHALGCGHGRVDQLALRSKRGWMDENTTGSLQGEIVVPVANSDCDCERQSHINSSIAWRVDTAHQLP